MARETGAYALSIGTSLAFESIFNTQAPEEQRKKVKSATKLMVSVATLFRNCLESHTKDNDYSPKTLSAIIAQEMDLIDELCEKNLSRKVKPFYYFATTEKFPKMYPHAQWREKDTERHRTRLALAEETIGYVIRDHGVVTGEYKDLSFNFDRYDSGMIVTHLPYELLRFTDFPELYLVESHTGAFKNRTAWYTKFSDGKSLPPVPFCAFTLSVFGDSQKFKPQPKARSVVLNIAKESGWRGDTSMKLMRESVNRYRPKQGEDKSLVTRLLNME